MAKGDRQPGTDSAAGPLPMSPSIEDRAWDLYKLDARPGSTLTVSPDQLARDAFRLARIFVEVAAEVSQKIKG